MTDFFKHQWGGLRRMRRSLAVMVAGCLWMGVGILQAEEKGEGASAGKPPPEELLTARTLFFEAILSESQLLTEQYVRALGKTELEAAERGDYQEALRVQHRREELKAIYAGAESTLVKSEATALPVEKALLTGGVEILRESLEGWRLTTSHAEWRGVSLEPGEYYLEFEAAMVPAPLIPGARVTRTVDAAPVEKAGFEFFEVSLLPGAMDNRRGFDIEQTADGVTFAPYRIGPISYPRSPVTLRLSSQAAFPLNIIRIKSLRLVPKRVEDELEAVTIVSQVGGEADEVLGGIRKSLNEELLVGYEEAAREYAGELREWASNGKGRKDSLSAEIDALKMQMSKLKDHPEATPSVAGMLGGFGAFEDVPEAMYVAGSATSGHGFEFRSEGGVFRVRLFGVRCMPPEGGKGSVEDAEFFARHFGVSREDATSLGLVAMEFATGYLEGKIVRLLVQSERAVAEGEPRLALVFVPDVGLFQNVLVDQGLAAVKKEDAQQLKGAMPKAVIGSLEAREQAARERSQPPGAWALNPEGDGSR